MLGLAAAVLSPIVLLADAIPAQAGPFEAIFRAFRGRPVERYSEPYNSYAPSGDPWGELLNSRERREPADPRLRAEGPRQIYCVRLCDGRYFPLPRSVGTAIYSPDKTCNALCPAAETKIFSGPGIGPSIAADGTRYAKLENAFVYRERVVDGCTCNGKDPGGLARVEPESDPTLKPGDIVVTETRPTVFKGGKPPHQAGDFTPALDDRKLPKNLREQLSEIRVAPAPSPADATSAVAPPPGANLAPQRNIAAGEPWRDLAMSQAWRELAARQNIFSGLASQFWTR
jgi:hypothetical protein